MKKRIYLFLFLLPALLILGGCGKKTDSNKVSSEAQNPAAQNNVVGNQEKTKDTKTVKSVSEIIANGQSLSCTFSYTDAEQGITESGNFYVNGPQAKFRSEAEIVTKDSDKKITTYMIGDGNYAYSWNGAEKTGFKISMKEGTPVAQDTKAQNNQRLDQKMNFDCRNWSVDNSKFILPPGVTFTDFSTMIKNLNIPAVK